MPRLADTTLRLLGQEPLAGLLPSSEQLRLAELLDRAGFAYLEVSGGGCFETAVRRGIESPWERIRAIKARTTTPLGMALRGRVLVGTRPVSVDLAERFVACAAESGIDVFRLHDPLNDVSNLREAAGAITRAGSAFGAGLVYSPGHGDDGLVEKAKLLPELGAERILVHDATGSLSPQRAEELAGAVKEATSLPVGFYCQGAGGSALASALEAARVGADLVASSVYPLALTLHRVAAESAALALAELGLDTGVDVDAVWRASRLVNDHLGEQPVAPTPPRVSTLAAERRLPPGLVAALAVHLRANAVADRLEDVLDELERIRVEVGSPPLASPIGQILGSQALVHVLAAERYTTMVDELKALIAGHLGTPPAEVDPQVRRALELLGGDEPAVRPLDIDAARSSAGGLAVSEEELCLVALFGDSAEPLLRTVRGRGRRDDEDSGAGQGSSRSDRIREIVRIVQESGVHEVTIEDAGMRVTVRRTEERTQGPATPEEPADVLEGLQPAPPATSLPGLVRIEAPMVGTFYRAPEPGADPFISVGDVVVPGQTLCILEAMKLMNEVKAEQAGIIRMIHVENAQPVEYGQLLFELEPADGKPPLL